MFTSLYASGYSLIDGLGGQTLATVLALANLALFYTYLLAESVRGHRLKGIRYAYCYSALEADLANMREQIGRDSRLSATLAMVTLFTVPLSIAFCLSILSPYYAAYAPEWTLPALLGGLSLVCAVAAHHFAVSSRDYIIATLADEEIPWADLDTGYWARLHRNAYYITATITAYITFWAAYGGYYVLR